MYYCTYLYALRQSNQKNQHRDSLGAASKDQMVSYDQETNAISATSSYSHDTHALWCFPRSVQGNKKNSRQQKEQHSGFQRGPPP